MYGIVAQAGGDVSIASQVGSGTTIQVNLPVTSEAKSGARVPKPDARATGKGETVLLVEDADVVREPARRMLVRHGYTVLAAANVDDAMSLLEAHPERIDLLLTDVVMPGRSGKELADEVVARSSGDQGAVHERLQSKTPSVIRA